MATKKVVKKVKVRLGKKEMKKTKGGFGTPTAIGNYCYSSRC